MIPKQLQSNQFRFIKIADTKEAIEKSWGKINNYLYNDEKFLKYLEENKRYGIVCGIGNLLVIDFDSQELQDKLTDVFPETFTTKTANKQLYHLYYIADNCETIRINDLNKKRIADVQGNGTYVVAPNTILANGKKYEIVKDIEIAKVGIETIRKIFAPWSNAEKTRIKTEIQIKDSEVKSIIDKLKVPELLQRWNISLSKNPTDCPFHSSVGGKCLSYTDTLWHCFDCGKGGSIIQLIMEKENMDFHHAKKYLADELRITINDVDLFIQNKEEIVENYYKVHPFFYDEIGLFWFWDCESMCYTLKDELDLMNDIKKVAAQKNFSMVNSGFWGEMNRALKLVGRNFRPREWHYNWIQFNDIVYDIDTGKTFEPSITYFNVNPIPHNLGVDDKTPNIDILFTEWVGHDKVLELKELCFFCLIQGYPIHRIFFLFGQGLNGKGAFLRFLINLVGLKNVTSSSIKKIISRPFEPSKLYKKLICQMGETNFQILEDTDVLKQLSGQDLISAEFKGKDGFDFMNVAKIIIATNCLPPTLDNTQGWYRRIKIIDFPNQFKEGIDPLLRIPQYEYDNFCKQLMQIGFDLLARGIFTNDGTVAHRQQEYELRSDPLKQFIEMFFDRIDCEKLPYFEFCDKFIGYLLDRRYRIMSRKEISTLLEKDGFMIRKENVKIGDKLTSWNYIYGLNYKKKEKGEKQEIIPIIPIIPIPILVSLREKTDIEYGNMGIIDTFSLKLTEKLNLYQAIQQLDKGSGVEMGEIQNLMKCSDKDFEQYVNYGKSEGNVFECRRGWLKLL